MPGFNIEKTVFSSENTFSFQIKEGFKIYNLEINSNMIIEQLSVKNDFDLKNFFPNINNTISLKNNKVNISYKKNALFVNGKGDIIYQNKEDELNYNFIKKKRKIKFRNFLKNK